MHPWHSVQMGAFWSLPHFAFFQKTIPCFVIEFFMIPQNTPAFWLLSLINQEEKRNCFEGQVCPLHKTKVCRMAVRRKTFPTDQNFPRDPQMTSNWALCWVQHYFMPDMSVFQSIPPPVFLIFVWFFLFRCSWKKFGLFSVPLFLWFLSFCVFYSCRYSCESCGLFSIPLFLSVSYLFVLLFLADVPARVLVCFPSLSFSVFLATISPPTVPLYSLQHVSRDKSQGKNPSNKSRSHIFLPKKLPQPSDLR